MKKTQACDALAKAFLEGDEQALKTLYRKVHAKEKKSRWSKWPSEIKECIHFLLEQSPWSHGHLLELPHTVYAGFICQKAKSFGQTLCLDHLDLMRPLVKGQLDSIRLSVLLSEGAVLDNLVVSKLIKIDDHAALKIVLKHQKVPKLRDCLTLALKEGASDCLKLLIKNGASLGSKKKQKIDSLKKAYRSRDARTIEFTHDTTKLVITPVIAQVCLEALLYADEPLTREQTFIALELIKKGGRVSSTTFYKCFNTLEHSLMYALFLGLPQKDKVDLIKEKNEELIEAIVDWEGANGLQEYYHDETLKILIEQSLDSAVHEFIENTEPYPLWFTTIEPMHFATWSMDEVVALKKQIEKHPQYAPLLRVMPSVIGVTRETGFTETLVEKLQDSNMVLFDDPQEPIEDFLARIDGLVIPGGVNVPTVFYEQAPKPPNLEAITGIGDRFNDAKRELELMRAAKSMGMPIWGICRGHQLVCVNEGAQLFSLSQKHHDDYMPMTVQKDTNLFDLLKPMDTMYQSLYPSKGLDTWNCHYQSVSKRRFPETLRINAVDKEQGTVKGCESKDPRVALLMGTQFHPEQRDDPKNNLIRYSFEMKAAEYRQRKVFRHHLPTSSWKKQMGKVQEEFMSALKERNDRMTRMKS